LAKRLFSSLILFAGLIFSSASGALEIPPLKETVNDLAGIMPEASIHDLEERLRRFKTQTGYTVAVVTVPSLENEDLEEFGRRAFKSLPLKETEARQSLLLIVALKERKVRLQAGSELQQLFPEPLASQKLQAHVALYFDGLRRDLGVHAGVHYIFQAIRGEVRIDGVTEVEKLEEASIHGGGAGAIFSIFLGPFFAFWTGVLWGIYATRLGLPRLMRLLMGILLGGGAAKLVALFMSFISSVGGPLWYFILAISIALGALGSLTEFWMSGDWRGIPRIKDPARRRPEDNMGI
jgi:uncharacterized protein